jgi:hypothetical protein
MIHYHLEPQYLCVVHHKKISLSPGVLHKPCMDCKQTKKNIGDLRNKSWKPECVGRFNMDWRILESRARSEG